MVNSRVDAELSAIADPDFRIHVSDGLLEMHDGPFLEQGPKSMAGRLIVSQGDRRIPDRDRLALRFEEFKIPG
jgi:putative restriction endonuclease